MRYYFGRCRVDTLSREVTLDGEATHLSPKAFELLRLLIDARPRVVPKAELMNALWPDSFVEEANLPVLISDVRTAIGDTKAGLIKTHRGVGYGFAAEVTETHSAGDRVQPNQQVLVLVLQDRRVVLSAGINIVGRDRQAEVHVNDASVSRRHARVIIDGDSARVEDLQSKNGTWVRGVLATQPTALTDGDVVTFGGIDARFGVETSDDPVTVTA